jgi:hypothetical protein
LRAAAELWPDTLRQYDFQFPLTGTEIVNELPRTALEKASIPIEVWFNQESSRRPGTHGNLSSVPPRFVIVYILAYETEKAFRYFATQFRSLFTFMGLPVPQSGKPLVHFVNTSTRYIAGYDVSVLFMPDLGSFEIEYSQLLWDILEIQRDPVLLINTQAILAITKRYPQLWVRMLRHSVPPEFQEWDDCPDGEVIWQEPSPTLLPHRRDLFRWRLNGEGQDTVLYSIKFSVRVHQKWRALMEWMGGRIIAGVMSGSPIAVFNFEFSDTLGTNFEGNPNTVDSFVRFRHVALCLLSLMCEAMAAVECIIT